MGVGNPLIKLLFHCHPSMYNDLKYWWLHTYVIPTRHFNNSRIMKSFCRHRTLPHPSSIYWVGRGLKWAIPIVWPETPWDTWVNWARVWLNVVVQALVIVQMNVVSHGVLCCRQKGEIDITYMSSHKSRDPGNLISWNMLKLLALALDLKTPLNQKYWNLSILPSWDTSKLVILRFYVQHGQWEIIFIFRQTEALQPVFQKSLIRMFGECLMIIIFLLLKTKILWEF